MLARLASLFDLFGLDAARTTRSIRSMPWFLKNYRTFKNAHDNSKFEFDFGKWYPCLDDRQEESGVARGHYFHQDLLVARRIFERQPIQHADFGSRIDGFVAHVASYRAIDVFDIRPLSSDAKNITFRRLDLMKGMDKKFIGYFDSVSCLHALEHFGLGRYGDELDYYGHVKGFNAISDAVGPKGWFYLSVPMGRQRIEFNAHRVFSLAYLRQMCERQYVIDKFSYVDDDGRLFEDVPIDSKGAIRNYDCEFGLAILEMKKK